MKEKHDLINNTFKIWITVNKNIDNFQIDLNQINQRFNYIKNVYYYSIQKLFANH